MSKTKEFSSLTASEFFKRLDLSKLDPNTAQYIRSEILSFENIKLLDGTTEFDEVRNMIEENYPQALGIIPVPQKDIEDKKKEPIKVPKEITGKVNKKEQKKIQDAEKKAAKEKHKQEVEEIEGLIELMQDTVKDNPNDTDSKDYLELLQDTITELKKKKFEEGGGLSDDDNFQNDDYKLEYIGELIKKGNTSGYEPNWTLTITFDGEIDDADRQHIGTLVGNGFTSGEIVSGEESQIGWWSIVVGEEMKRGGGVGEKFKAGDFVKKKGSNLSLKVLEVSHDKNDGKDYITIYNDVLDYTQKVNNISDYELVKYANGGGVGSNDKLYLEKRLKVEKLNGISEELSYQLIDTETNDALGSTTSASKAEALKDKIISDSSERNKYGVYIKGDNVLFTKRPALKGVIVKPLSNGLVNAEWTDSEGLLVKKDRTRTFDVSVNEITLYKPLPKVDKNRIEKFKENGGGLDNKDLLPPVMEYSKNLDLAVSKFGITKDEARNKYGKYTIGEWENLLSGDEITTPKGRKFTYTKRDNLHRYTWENMPKEYLTVIGNSGVSKSKLEVEALDNMADQKTKNYLEFKDEKLKTGGSVGKDAGLLTEKEKFELKVLQGLTGFNNGQSLNGLLESIGLSNYRLSQYASKSEVSEVNKSLSSLIKKGYVVESGLGYKITQTGADYLRSFNYGTFAKGGGVGETIEVTSKNIGDFYAYQGASKKLNIGEKLHIVKTKIPYPQIRGTFTIVTDWQPNKSTLYSIERASESEADKYGWKKGAEIAKQIIAEKKDAVFFNRWSIADNKYSNGGGVSEGTEKDLRRLILKKFISKVGNNSDEYVRKYGTLNGDYENLRLTVDFDKITDRQKIDLKEWADKVKASGFLDDSHNGEYWDFDGLLDLSKEGIVSLNNVLNNEFDKKDYYFSYAILPRGYDFYVKGISYANGGGVGDEKEIQERLEYLRGELRAEKISQGELIELQSLAKHIDPSDVELLEAAGVPEFPDDNSEYEGKYVYKFHEERGEISAYVEDMTTGNEVWSFKYPDYSLPEDEREFQSTPVDDGFMRHFEDIKGLENYLKDLGAIPNDAQILSEVEANKIAYYKNGGGIRGWFSRKPKERQASEYEVFVTRKDGSTDNPIFGSQQAAESHKSNMERLGHTATVKPIFKNGGGVGGNDKKYIMTSYSGSIVEDSYEEGEIGNSVSDFDIKESKTFNSKKELIDYMNKLMYVDYKEEHFDWETGEGKSIHTDVTVSMDGRGDFLPADDKEKELWKKGKKKLYNCHYWFYVVPVTVHDEYSKGGGINKHYEQVNDLFVDKKTFTVTTRENQKKYQGTSFEDALNWAKDQYTEGKSTYKYYKVPNEQLWAVQECNSEFNDGHGGTCIVIVTKKTEAEASKLVERLTQLQTVADSKMKSGGRVWTNEQEEKVNKLDTEFDESLKQKNIDPHSREAGVHWREGGFQQRFRDIFGKDDSVKVNGGKITKKFVGGGQITDIHNEGTATDKLRKKLSKKVKAKDAVVNFGYTDYGGTFYDKVAINYFIKKHPKNIVHENAAHNGQNAFVFGKVADKYLKERGTDGLAFGDMEQFYYQLESEQEKKEFDRFLKGLKNDYTIKKGALQNLLENKSGYYQMQPNELDFNSEELTQYLIDNGFAVSKMSKGGNVNSDIERMKQSLIAKAKKKGLYENFGQEEVKKLEDKYGRTPEVNDFDNWAMNFDLSQFKTGGSLKNKERVEIVLKHYLIAALWSSTDSDNEDTPFDTDYSVEDFDKRTVDKVRQLIIKFMIDNEADLKASGLNDEQIGHDLWLTQVGHGAGFWDRGLDKELGDRLSSESKKLGQSANLFAQKGKVHIDGLSNVEEYAKGGGVGEKKIKVRDIDTGRVRTWTVSELLGRINEDNATDEFNYDESDWIEGFNETLLEFYSLNDKNGKPLNDLSKMKRGGMMKFDTGGGVTDWTDLSYIVPAKLKVEKTTAFGNPEYLNVMYNGKKVARFYYNMRGYNQDFSLKNKEGVHYGFGGDKSESRQISDFKSALREGFTFIKN